MAVTDKAFNATTKRRIARNRYDNWNGYEGTRKVREFGSDESRARSWMNGETDPPYEPFKDYPPTVNTESVDQTPDIVTPKQASGLAQRITQPKSLPTVPHVIVTARAGTGKTTTLVEGLKRLKGLRSNITPSPQQAAVWDALSLSREARTICFVAFNKSIATELQGKVPSGCDAMTMHAMGFKAVQKQFGRLDVNSFRVQDIIASLMERDIREIRKDNPVLLKATEELVGLCKMNLVGVGSPMSAADWEDALDELAAHYDVELNSSRSKVFELVPQVLDRCRDVSRDRRIDFNDMIWLPVVLNLPLFRYDLLLVDEAQDLNRCQQALAKRAGNRLILCGDPAQAIYGFAGADSESMSRMFAELNETPAGCINLPLTVTRRCAKAIVREAQKIVPDFEAFADNPEGKISHRSFGETQANTVAQDASNYASWVNPGDRIICRVNAPLVSQCFRFLKDGRKANILGRDVAAGLVSTVKKVMKGYSGPDNLGIVELHGRLSDWLADETRRETAKRNPSEGRLIALQDRFDCLMCFAEDAETVAGVIAKIENIFTDDKQGDGILLSSIHKAKGLEARRVYFLMPKGGECPHPMAKTAWQKEQELNLLYVGQTRAIEELIYVR